ncbi:MAG TPA: ribonuclease HI [Stenomitos sp.]
MVTVSNPIAAIYTDGACSGNPGPGGWGVVVQFADGACQELGGHASQTTNNRMELQAAIEALRYVKQQECSKSHSVCVYTDSEYVKNGITKWVAGWKKRDWKTAQGKAVLNQDLWEALDELSSSQVSWQYIRSHAGHVGNERADAIARAFSLNKPIELAQVTDSAPLPLSPSPELASAPMSDSTLSPSPETSVSSESAIADSGHGWLAALTAADTIATQGFWITTAELVDLTGLEIQDQASSSTEWVWRNWRISQAQPSGDVLYWQLERVR